MGGLDSFGGGLDELSHVIGVETIAAWPAGTTTVMAPCASRRHRRAER
jgi:hypothetical protein